MDKLLVILFIYNDLFLDNFGCGAIHNNLENLKKKKTKKKKCETECETVLNIFPSFTCLVSLHFFFFFAKSSTITTWEFSEK